MNPLTPDFANTPASAQRPDFNYTPAVAQAQPVVSIITPYYNTGEIFFETAESILRQSLQQWEWLIVNDGSDQPEALNILNQFRGQDSRTRVIDLANNRGLPAARNAGIRQASADLVFFLDSDDLIEPTALEKMAWCLESYPEFGFCKGFTVWFGAQQHLNTSTFDAGELFLNRNMVTITAMVRRKLALSHGGFDESLVTGLEDWDFWLKQASHGHWGRTIPEPMDWFRRRQLHSDRWSAWTQKGVQAMRQELRRRYPDLYTRGFPPPAERPMTAFAAVRDEVPFANKLAKESNRLLLVIPWMAMGGAEKFDLDLITQLRRRGYEVSIATTLPTNYPWYRAFAGLTPDIFILPHFLRLNDYPRFLVYLIQSRQIDAVLLSNSELGYRLLPYLRSRCPNVAFVDFCHMEEEDWRRGGYPRQALAYQEVLDLNLVSSEHLREWMIDRGANPSQIEVCYTNVDTELLVPDHGLRSRVRGEMGISPDLAVILHAGRLCAQKQPRVLAEVLRELRARGLGFMCLVAGDGEERKWLSSYLRRQRLECQVRLLGAVSNERLHELLAASDILFLPSKMEGISLTIYEAMAMGVVPVSADVGGQRELVTPECGVLIAHTGGQEEVQAYADALQSLIWNSELRDSMGTSARNRVLSSFRIEQMGDRMDVLLDKARQQRRLDLRPQLGPGLALEYAVLAVEYARLCHGIAGLWKYQELEARLQRSIAILSPWAMRFSRVARVPRTALRSGLYRLRRLARLLKDGIWIVGHKVKVRVLNLKES